MIERTFVMTDPQNYSIHVYTWLPDNEGTLRGIVQIAHGMAESAARYRRFAEFLTNAGFVVFANDHRGHGFTAGHVSEIGIIGKDGYRWIMRNLKQLTDFIRDTYPDLPIILLGHSMGSFSVQQYMGYYGKNVDGIILSGSNGQQRRWMLYPGIAIAYLQSFFMGERRRSRLLHNMTLGSYNRYFKPNRTVSDWLSRDVNEVDRYVKDDPHCQKVFSAGFYRDFFMGLREIYLQEHLDRIPRELPLYILSGDQDPVGELGNGVLRLEKLYKAMGMADLTVRIYSGARHEMLNETNRDEVMSDLLQWLNERFTPIKN
jgi:alpha-beta hydrolase superfamily lysophospholipase